MSPALIQRYPQLASAIPWLHLGQWPTPVARLPLLGKHLQVDLWAKRDDKSSPIYGGNKIRKLELLLAEATQQGSRTIITVGALGSHHVLATVIYARQLGLKTQAVVVRQPMTTEVQATLNLIQALGVELIPCSSRAQVPLLLHSAWERAERPYLIGAGGSSPLGTVGYVSAALELQQQIEQGLLPAPDDIFIALGSGGSMAGLVLGLALARLKSRVIGVRVVDRILINATRVRLLAHRTARLLSERGLKVGSTRGNMSVCHDHFGGRYGLPTPAALDAVTIARDTEGLKLETTYTAKALAALMEYCRGPGRGRRILFWNTFNSQDTSPLLQPIGQKSEL